MNPRTLIIIIMMTFITGQAKAEAMFPVTVELESESVSLSELPSFKYEGNDGYYFTIKVSVTNREPEKKTFMVDDDCTYASWKITGDMVKLLVESCRNNVYHQISLIPGEKYESILKVWFPNDPNIIDMKFKVGFIEIVDYKTVSGPYWSDVTSVKIKK